jgi:hypothetical protein
MNNPWVTGQARATARRLLADPAAGAASMIERLYLLAFARAARPEEISRAEAFLAGEDAQLPDRRAGKPLDESLPDRFRRGRVSRAEVRRMRYTAHMATLVIEAFPEALHAKLKRTAEAHRRSITEETVHLLEAALAVEVPGSAAPKQGSYWAQRRLLPEYEALLKSGALAGGTDSSAAISEERDQR